MKAIAKKTKKQVTKAKKQTESKKTVLAPALISKPTFVSGPQSTVKGNETVHWKDLVFIHTQTGVVINHENDPVAHAQLCQRHRNGVEEIGRSIKAPRVSSFSNVGYEGISLEGNFYVATITMIGLRQVEYAYLDECAKAFKEADSAKWCLNNLDTWQLTEMSHG